MTQINTETQRAVCAVCGPIDVRRRTEGVRNIHAAPVVKWRCRGAERARIWAMQMGVSADQVEQWRLEQDGKCAICQGDNGGRPLFVDHCHRTGRGRGLLCTHCNGGLGMFADDPARLASAIDYLRTTAE